MAEEAVETVQATEAGEDVHLLTAEELTDAVEAVAVQA